MSGLKRTLSVWRAVGLSVALMASSMAANINPQQTAAAAGRAVPLAFLLSAVGVLLVAYGFVRMCQYYQHAGSVYAFVGSTLGPRAGVVSGIGLLGTYTFYAVVTAVEMLAFGSDAAKFHDSPSLLGELGTAYVGAWVGDVITLGAAISAFGCCLACVVGGSRLLFALGRDAFEGRGVAKTSANGAPAVSATVVTGLAALFIAVCAVFFGATPADTFAWSGSIGTLILLIVYLLTTLGSIRLVFVQRKLAVPRWQVVFPLCALVLLGYTVYVNVIPYPESGPAQ